jgi:hypothetical protein
MEYVKVTFPTNRLVYIDREKSGTVQEGRSAQARERADSRQPTGSVSADAVITDRDFSGLENPRAHEPDRTTAKRLRTRSMLP